MNEDLPPQDPQEFPPSSPTPPSMPDFGPSTPSFEPPVAPEPLPMVETNFDPPADMPDDEEDIPIVTPIQPPRYTESEPLIDTNVPAAFAGTIELLERIRAEVSSVFLGQEEVVDQILIALLANGHILLEGKPGLGKTHLVLALSRTFGGDFARIQFTPDLMPSDVTGHTLFDMGSQTFRIRKGPVFTNLLLADEINRAPAKTQSALLEVMQERQVTIDGETMPLDPPFLVFATQNPIEQEGTYPLPEAQLDRFLLKVLIDYPEDSAHEADIVRGVTSGTRGTLDARQIEPLCNAEDILQAQADCAAVQAVDEVITYAVNIARATREARGIALGAGTRGAISMVQAAKAKALLEGRDFIIPDDVKACAVPTLRHRMTLAPELAISGETVDRMIGRIVDTVEAPRT